MGKKSLKTAEDRRPAEAAPELSRELAQAALRERIKELTCLYGIAQLAAAPGLAIEQVLQQIADLLPPAWQYPEVAVGRIAVAGRAYSTGELRAGWPRQAAEIASGGRRRGLVEVAYAAPRPPADEGPFLKEERSLIDAVARQVALILERRQAQEEKDRLEAQLRHADRLATIGQLAAGVAHELNEPLGNVLGFAQLARKRPDLPGETAADLDRIVAAAMHAREVIRQLMTFARQTPPAMRLVDLNAAVEEGLAFLEGRSASAGVELVRRLSPAHPQVTADPAQINQVLINLVVNALQAMPSGGTLTVHTRALPGEACLVVEDTGVGMTAEVREKAFLPFFTTKDVNQGTGLGLAVVHGIVAAHGGSIAVESEPGRGARFEVRLPAAGPIGEQE